MDSCPEIVRNAVDYAFEALGRQVLYLCCYERNVDDLDNVAEKLREARQRLQHSVDTARQKGEHIEDDVQHWMKKVNVISEEIQKFRQEGNHARAEFSNCRFPHLWFRYQLSRRAKKLSEAIVEIESKGTFGKISYRMAPRWWTGISSVQASGSRITLTDEILESLKDSDLNMFGVFGLGGVGKTTLVTQVAKRVAEDQLFNVVVKAAATQKMEVSKIQKELAESLGLVLEEETEGIRAIRLKDRLKMEKSVLIVLDDLWEGLDLDEVGIPFGDEHKGCKILLTSRSEEVLSNQMDCQKTFYVDCLPDDEAWSLFKNLAELDGSNVEHEILTIATEVTKRCSGLPIAIITVAKALRKKRVAQWRDALRQLKSPTSRDITKMVDSCIEFSYRHLENHELQSLFLLCACSGQSIILVTDLLKYCVGLGLLGGTSTVAEFRDKLETLLTTLKASCLLFESDSSDYLSLHDVVRDVGISIAAKRQNQFTVRFDKLSNWPDQSRLQFCTAINLIDCEIICDLPEELSCPTLIFLYINNKDLALKIPDNFFKGVCKLKVLDLTRMQFSCLPSSMAHLTNLESLSLDQCILQDIEVIGVLKKLKVLSLVYSDIRRLPQSFENLTQLQLLDLSGCSKLQLLPLNVISAWKKLEELLMQNTYVQWDHDGSNACLTELNHLPMLKTLEIHIRDSSMPTRGLQMENLLRYKILIGDGWNWSCKSNILRALKIKLIRNDVYLERWVKILLKTVQDLYLDELLGVKNVVNELNEEGFPYLTHFHLQNNDEAQYIINLKEWFQPFEVFPVLESLVFHNLLNLEKICHGHLPLASFGKLKVIKVKKCRALRYLLSLYTARRLLQLMEIEVSECMLMKQIFGGEEMEDDNVDFGVLELHQLHSLTIQHLPMLAGFSTNENTSEIPEVGNLWSSHVENGLSMPLFGEKVAFLNLETLKIASVHFQKIWQDGPSARLHVQSLTNLTVDSCRHLEYLFSVSVVKCLVKLKYLELSNCLMMEDIIHLEERTNIPDSEELWFPSLETIKVSNMNSLRSLWDKQVAPNAYPKLKTIEIESCEKLTTIIPTYMLARLESLEELNVGNCSSLHEVFSMESNETLGRMEMKKLKSLYLKHLPELKMIWSKEPKGDFSFQSLELVEGLECHSPKNIFTPSCSKSLADPRKLGILDNFEIDQIVPNESVKEAVQFVFPEMTAMWFSHMPKLNWFYPEMHTLECPKLEDLSVSNCDNLELFGTQMLGPSELEKTTVVNAKELGIRQPLFLIEKLLPALQILSLEDKHIEMIQNVAKFSTDHFRKLKVLRLLYFVSQPGFFPYWLLHRIPTLEHLMVSSSFFREVFPCASLPTQARDDHRTVCHIKVLYLCHLPELEYICKEGFQLDQTLDKLETLLVDDCESLKKLLPSNISANHLTVMEITRCDKLESLSSISTFKSLVQLQALKIKQCKMMVEILADDGFEGEGEVEFSQLKILHLKGLPRLNYFSSINCAFKFPNLVIARVIECPRLEFFSKNDSSTPILQKVQPDKNGDEWYWEGNLNATIMRMFNDRVSFRNMGSINLFDFLDFEDIKHRSFHNGMFFNLTNLVLHNCEVWSPIISYKLLCSLNKLEELKVENCETVEAVFDFDGANDKTAHVSPANPLKTLILKGLPKLKRIWNTDPEDAVRFSNLQQVHVEECCELKNVFQITVAKCLPRLQNLVVKVCDQLEEIIEDWECSNLDKLVPSVFFNKENEIEFQELQVLELNNLPTLQCFWSLDMALSCPKLSQLSVEECPKMKTFIGGVLNAPELRNVQLDQLGNECSEGNLNISIEKFFNTKVAFLNLETLKLASVHFQKIWLNGPSARLHVKNLTSLIVDGCRDLKYLFSVSVVTGLVKLNYIEISSCLKLEDIIHLEERTDISDSDEIWFPSLETLKLSNMNSLRSIWDQHVTPNAYPKLKTIEIEDCEKLTNIIPTYMLVRLKSLEALTISNCSSLHEVFSLDANENLGRLEIVKLKNLILKQLPELKYIWSEDPVGDFSFQNLQIVQVWRCNSLKSIFTLSIAKNLANIIEMDMDTNSKIEEIVLKDDSVKEAIGFVFPEMTKMRLMEMPQLEWFYRGMHSLESPKLKDLSVISCGNLELFGTQLSGPSKLEKANLVNQKELVIQQPFSFELLPALEALSLDGKAFQKKENMVIFSMNHFRMLKQLKLKHFDNRPASFPYWFLQRIPTLEVLTVAHSSFREVFPCADLPIQAKDDNVVCNMKLLDLFNLPELEYICKEGLQLDQTLAKLESLSVENCSSLTKLLPSNISSNHLTVMEIIGCDMLKSLSSISTFKGLVQLEALKIDDCEIMVEIIADDGYEGGEGEVEFSRLRFLHLKGLQRLKHFSGINCAFRFPNLEIALVNDCPSLEIFSKKDSSTPILTGILANEYGDEWHWEGNLNATIRRMFSDMCLPKDKQFIMDASTTPRHRFVRNMLVKRDVHEFTT